ncbi:Hypothetical predicted protein [Paramuricea clavata]|uniref:Uncharacterized protein n=1 Tax=Paramuricea clavata TaxID=317549 RepID=A0A7D9DZ02_PARCT|nr:Hypothetical predicted protein [Paramuricea clavata]
MASLLVSLHEVVEKYIKKANDKELAGKIGTEVLEHSRQVAKKYLFTAEDACKFHVAELFPMLSRELLHFTKILRRRMKTSTTLSHPWQIRIVRNIPVEIFELLKETILRGGYGNIVKKTKSVEQLEISNLDAVYNWVKHVAGNNTISGTIETDFFSKLLKDGSCCKAIVSPEHPFIVKYSNTQENIQYVTRYGCWNAFGIPQHVLS